jgi:hypothetical protein
MDLNPPVGSNPNTVDVPNARESPYGPHTGRKLNRYLGGPAIQAEMVAPTSRKQCAVCDLAPRAEFIIRVPTGITDFTIHYGRWIVGENVAGTGTGISAPLETGQRTVSGATAGQLVSVELPTNTDAVWCYVDTFTGDVDPADSFRFWSRGLPS